MRGSALIRSTKDQRGVHWRLQANPHIDLFTLIRVLGKWSKNRLLGHVTFANCPL